MIWTILRRKSQLNPSKKHWKSQEEMKAADDGGVTDRGDFGWPTRAHTNYFLFRLPQQKEMRF